MWTSPPGTPVEFRWDKDWWEDDCLRSFLLQQVLVDEHIIYGPKWDTWVLGGNAFNNYVRTTGISWVMWPSYFCGPMMASASFFICLFHYLFIRDASWEEVFFPSHSCFSTVEGDAIDLPSLEGGAPFLNLEYKGESSIRGRPPNGWTIVLKLCLTWLGFFSESVCALSFLPYQCAPRLRLSHSDATRNSCTYLLWLSISVFLRHMNVEKRVLTFEIQAIVS